MTKPSKTMLKVAATFEGSRTWGYGGFETQWDLVLFADTSGLTEAQVERVLVRENAALCTFLGLSYATVETIRDRRVLKYFRAI